MKDPAQLPWKDLGVDVVFESTGIFTRPRRRGEASRRRREEGHHHRAREEAGHHSRAGCERRQVRPGHAPHHLERVVHDQLPGAAREGDSPVLWHPQGVDDDDSLVHERPAAARPAAQGSAPGARGRALDDSDDDGRGFGGRRSAAGAQGQARRLLDARPDAERLGRRPQRPRRTGRRPATR